VVPSPRRGMVVLSAPSFPLNPSTRQENDSFHWKYTALGIANGLQAMELQIQYRFCANCCANRSPPLVVTRHRVRIGPTTLPEKIATSDER
jgi:hypothetical protein